jgi:hypothetical protein
MREITPTLPSPLDKHVGSRGVAKATPYPVRSYRELVKQVAHVAHSNPDHLLFYRGQGTDYHNKAGSSSIYPSIYRSDPLTKPEITSRFARLKFQGLQLARAYKKAGMPGAEQLEAREILQWSIIQHYELGGTPLLDLTHSLAVACSFAQENPTDSRAFVFVFGLPHLANRISINSEHDIINVRLLSICPPDALRPYFQEGYLAGTWDVSDTYADKTFLDFNRRLIAKFEIPTTSAFWGKGFGRIPKDLLYPKNDSVKMLCDMIAEEPSGEVGAYDIGMFLLAWQEIERILIATAADRTSHITNLARAITSLEKGGVLSKSLVTEINALRRWRNSIVHGQEEMSPPLAIELTQTAHSIRRLLSEELSQRLR